MRVDILGRLNRDQTIALPEQQHEGLKKGLEVIMMIDSRLLCQLDVTKHLTQREKHISILILDELQRKRNKAQCVHFPIRAS